MRTTRCVESYVREATGIGEKSGHRVLNTACGWRADMNTKNASNCRSWRRSQRQDGKRLKDSPRFATFSNIGISRTGWKALILNSFLDFLVEIVKESWNSNLLNKVYFSAFSPTPLYGYPYQLSLRANWEIYVSCLAFFHTSHRKRLWVIFLSSQYESSVWGSGGFIEDIFSPDSNLRQVCNHREKCLL